MDTKSKKVNDVKFSQLTIELRNILDVEASSMFPNFTGEITNSNDLAGESVFRNPQ